VCRYIDDHFSTLANARPDIFTAGALNGFFGDMLTCSHVSSARNIVGGQLFRVSGNCDNIFFSPFVSFDMWKDFGLLLPVTSFVSRKVLPPTSRRLFGDQQDKNCAEETPVLTRNVTSLMFSQSHSLGPFNNLLNNKNFSPLKMMSFSTSVQLLFSIQEKYSKAVAAVLQGGSFVNGYGSRNMFGAPDATPEVDFFFLDVTQIFRKKNNIFPLQ
jgi:hypothetical protein